MPLRVVLVDDDRRFRTMARRALASEGVDVVAEVDGGDAFDTVAELQPDVVLLDIRMPGVDGLEVARRLRSHGGPTVVILTSTIDADEGRRLAGNVAHGYLPKDAISLAAILELAGP
jgi:CheY-like chemotaxis protein